MVDFTKINLQDTFNATSSNLVRGFFGEQQIGTYKRDVIRWQVPSKQYHIEMYINPQNISIQSSKLINEVRTKGGYIIQYWGENFDQATIAGTTGSGGVEGINLLKDIYRDEQLQVEDTIKMIVNTLRGTNATQIAQVAGLGIQQLTNLIPALRTSSPAQLKSLAARAANIKMFYQGVTYRGFFKQFTVTETADQLGLFNYDIQFTIVETVGKRTNFMPWHRKATTPAKGPLSYSRITQSPETILKTELNNTINDTRGRNS